MIHVVTGHICSGKSWHVRQHATPEDVVIDMDRIAEAISPEETQHHNYTQHVADIARVARWAAMDEAIRLHRAGGFDLWIIHAYPEDKDWTTYRRIGATVTAIECDDDTLRARAREQRPLRMRRLLEDKLTKAS